MNKKSKYRLHISFNYYVALNLCEVVTKNALVVVVG